jgi:cytochrome c-type biogenesis protein CcmF
MMDLFGSFAVLLALVACTYALAAGVLAHIKQSPVLRETARRAGVTVFPTLSLAMVCLWGLFFTDDFTVAYVADHSNRDLAPFYKIAALWSGQEGSLLFWSWLLSAYMFVVLVKHRREGELRPLAGTVLAGVQLFFLILNAIVVSPFRQLAEVTSTGAMQSFLPADGRGLNPLLQYPEMVIHPPMLYLGYVGFAVPFAFALAALITRSPGEKWIHVTRRWTMIAWGFLSIGILLGAHWAYAVLGWGGYWGWDPVENASFMPWLTGTAFLHSVMMQERKGMLKVWNVWLVFITFMLCIFGTFLTRSGIVSSVHAFAQSPIGPWFSGFLTVVFAVCLFWYSKNRDYLKSDNKLETLLSRESSFLFNNLVLLAACFAVLWGTLFPVISEAVTGSKVSVGAPFFNRVNVPIFLFLLFLTGIGPLLAWRRTSLEGLKRNFTYPTLAGLLTGVIMLITGVRHPYALIAFILSAFVAVTILMEFWRGAAVIRSQTGRSFIGSLVHLSLRNTRRYGGYVIHLGIVVMFIGLAGAAFNQEREMEMTEGSEMQLGRYAVTLKSRAPADTPNYFGERLVLDVSKDGRLVETLEPERRLYKASEQPLTKVTIHSTWAEDLYVYFAGANQDTGAPIIHAYLNPLVRWLWVGGGIVLFGTLMALYPGRRPVKVAVTEREQAQAKKEEVVYASGD